MRYTLEQRFTTREHVMTREIIFRVLLAVLAVALYCNHHVLHGKRHTTKVPLAGIELWLFTTAWLWTASLVLYVLGPPGLEPKAPLPEWLRWVGVGAMATCLPLSNWIYRSLGVHFSRKLELQKGHVLVQEGPYRYVRHPMYSTRFLCAAASCLISANYAVLVTTLAAAGVMLLRIRREEAMLQARFGEDYQRYRQQTGALLPKLLQWRYARSAQ